MPIRIWYDGERTGRLFDRATLFRYAEDMTTLEQLDDFARFAKAVVEKEGAELPLEVVFQRWNQGAWSEEDLVRIQASVRDYQNGERGEPLEDFLARFDEGRAQGERK